MRSLILLAIAACASAFAQQTNNITTTPVDRAGTIIPGSINCSRHIMTSAFDVGLQVNTALSHPPPPCASTVEVVIELSGVIPFSTGIVIAQSDVTVRCASAGVILDWQGGGGTTAVTIGDGTNFYQGVNFADCSLNGIGAGTAIWVRGGSIQNNFVTRPNIGFTGGAGFTTAILVGESGTSSYNLGIVQPRIALNPANLVTGQIAIDLVSNGHAIGIDHPVIQDNEANSTGSIGLRVNNASMVSVTGGNIQGCAVNVDIGTGTGNVETFTIFGTYFEPQDASTVDVKVGPNALNATFYSTFHNGNGIQDYFFDLKDGSFGTRIIGPSFIAYATEAVHNEATNNNTVWSIDSPRDSGSLLYDSALGLQYAFSVQLADFHQDNVTIGPNRRLIAPVMQSSSTGAADDTAWPIQLSKADAISFETYDLAGAPAYNSGTTYAAGDTVSYSGQFYASQSGGNTNHQPDTSPTYWRYSRALLVLNANNQFARICNSYQGTNAECNGPAWFADRYGLRIQGDDGTGYIDVRASAGGSGIEIPGTLIATLINTNNAVGVPTENVNSYQTIGGSWYVTGAGDTGAQSSKVRYTFNSVASTPISGVMSTASGSGTYISGDPFDISMPLGIMFIGGSVSGSTCGGGTQDTIFIQTDSHHLTFSTYSATNASIAYCFEPASFINQNGNYRVLGTGDIYGQSLGVTNGVTGNTAAFGSATITNAIVVGYLEDSGAIASNVNFIRMLATDQLGWMNHSFSGDNVLRVDGSERLLYNGDVVVTATGLSSYCAVSGCSMSGNLHLGTGYLVNAFGSTIVDNFSHGYFASIQDQGLANSNKPVCTDGSGNFYSGSNTAGVITCP